MTRSANMVPPHHPGLLLVLKPHRRAWLKHNETRGGWQDLENWLLEGTEADGTVWLDPKMLERLIRCCRNYGSGGPNLRVRRACIPALRDAGIELMPEWQHPSAGAA